MFFVFFFPFEASVGRFQIEELYDNGRIYIYGLTIGTFKDEAYFGNWYGFTIMRVNLKTKERHSVVSKGAGLVLHLNYFDGYLYWTRTLKSARIRSPNPEVKIVRYFNESLDGMAIKHPSYQVRKRAGLDLLIYRQCFRLIPVLKWPKHAPGCVLLFLGAHQALSKGNVSVLTITRRRKEHVSLIKTLSK